MVGTAKNDLSHNLLLNDRQVASHRKAFTNISLKNTKLSKTQIFKVIQSGGFLGRLFEPLLNIGLPLIKNVLKLFMFIKNTSLH